MGGGYYPTNACEGLAAGAAFISFINVFGGFIVTARQLYTILAWELITRNWSILPENLTFAIKVDPLNLESQNQTKNIYVVLPSFQIKI